MAVIEFLRIGASVSVDGQELPEYADSDPPQSLDVENGWAITCNKYIEAQDDKEFVICLWSMGDWTTEPDNFCLAYDIYVDGTWSTTTLATAYDLGHVPWVRGISGVVRRKEDHDLYMLHKFKFSSITTVEEADFHQLAHDRDAAKGMGTIQVRVRRAINTGLRSNHSVNPPEGKSLFLAEKVIKGESISHGTAYSTPVQAPKTSFFLVNMLDTCPLAVFNFKYRSRAALQAEMVIPRSPTPYPTIKDEEKSHVTRDYRRRSRCQTPVKREKSVTIKREFDEVIDLTADAAVPRARKIPRKCERVEIDLTSD